MASAKSSAVVSSLVLAEKQEVGVVDAENRLPL
jgi:hypothetical protein